MGDLRIGGSGASGIDRFQSLREEALRRSRSAMAGAAGPGKNSAVGASGPSLSTEARAVSASPRSNPVPDTRSPLGRLIDLRA